MKFPAGAWARGRVGAQDGAHIDVVVQAARGGALSVRFTAMQQRPTKRKRSLELYSLIQVAANQVTRAWNAPDLRTVPVDPDPAGELKQRAPLEVDEEHPRPQAR